MLYEVITVMLGLESISTTTRTEWQDAVREILYTTDFGSIGDFYISTEIDGDDAGRIRDLLERFGAVAAIPLLDGMLLEQDASRRRALIKLLTTLGPSIVPEVLGRLTHPKWYFVRNLV